MELEQRIQALESEVRTLKHDIQKTLNSIRENLPERRAASSIWQSKAWILALANTLIAIVLFANIYLYLPGGVPAEMNATLAAWLRAFWLAIAFVWLLLQMYPLGLLLAEDNAQWRQVGWHNAAAFVRARPGMIVALTFVVLVVSVVNTIVPAAWLVLAFALFLGSASLFVRAVLTQWWRVQSSKPE